ncbi:hypothetical protein KKJ30_03140 [Xenorhabdus bovienii]|nr:hypothetical protein [Xenorhabdus bovienii]MDE9480796.1 hypothetical protein [Xenorhabdus bovienii]
MSISRSSVVANIKNLEERYNIRFINRNTRYFSLTEEGKYIFEQSAKIEKILCETMGYLGDSAINFKKTIGIKIPGTLDISEVHNILSNYMNKHPETSVYIKLDDKIRNLIDEEIDLALHIGDLPNSNLHSRLVIKFNSYIIASEVYLKHSGISQHPDELIKHRCINFDHCVTGKKGCFGIKWEKLSNIPFGKCT